MSVRSSSSTIRRLGESSKKGADGRISAKAAAQDLSDLGVTHIVSLSECEGGLPEGLEDLAADFSGVLEGKISTAIAPLSMSLKGDQHKKSMKLTTLKKITGLFSKLPGARSPPPFVRFDKIQIMYVPLFGNRADCTGKITISLNDDSYENARKSVIQSVEFKAGEMAMAELSMDFVVRRCDLDKISLNTRVKGVEITGRSYGSLNIAFFVHETPNPMNYKTKEATLYYLDALDVPKDVNRKSVFNALEDVVKVEKKKNSRKMIEAEKMGAYEKELKKNNVALETDIHSETSSNSGQALEAGRKSVSHINEYLSNQRALARLQRSPSLSSMGSLAGMETMIHYLNPDSLLYRLDRAANEHIFSNMILEPAALEYDERIGCDFVRAKTVVRLMRDQRVLSSVLHKRVPLDKNVLSYKALVSDGLVDKLEEGGGEVILSKDDNIIFKFDVMGDSLVLKDQTWYGMKSSRSIVGA